MSDEKPPSFDRLLEDVATGNPSRQIRWASLAGLAALAAAWTLAVWLGLRPISTIAAGKAWKGTFAALLLDGR